MFIFFLSFLSLHFINYVCRVPCLYELCSLLFSFTYIQLQFPFPISFCCLLEFRPTFFLCVSSSIAFRLLTFFEFPDLRFFFAEASWLILTELIFHILSHPYLQFKSRRFITLQKTLEYKDWSNQNQGITWLRAHVAVAYNMLTEAKYLKAQFLTAIWRGLVRVDDMGKSLPPFPGKNGEEGKRQQVSPNRRFLSTKLYGAVTQNTIISM